MSSPVAASREIYTDDSTRRPVMTESVNKMIPIRMAFQPKMICGSFCPALPIISKMIPVHKTPMLK
jgi:hypothetical protein